ncbi:MAG: hypothetical protein JO356_01470 [Acidobacteria bacterium]|nr:hypothetical protein [Acidobacteriota bacterium]
MPRLNSDCKLVICFLTGLLVGAPATLRAQITLLLEEPYSYDGTFAGTGHAAVYLTRVCADSPTHLRRCSPAEAGAVISRYHGIAGRDWLAVPLMSYLYAVPNAEDIPLFVDPKLVTLLRQRYLDSLPLPAEKVAGSEGRYQLAGSAYDRTLYGFRIATREDQDDALIRLLNATPNIGSYELLKRNCADFAKQIVNFYYPGAIHRSIIADLGVTTPKQAAKSLVRSSKHHPEMQLTAFIIPQVPGLKRSKPVRGVLESLVLAKKYVTPVLLFHPFVVGTVEAAYWTGWHFNPASNALIFDGYSSQLEMPLSAEDRRSYENLVAMMKKDASVNEFSSWRKLESAAEPHLDDQGRPFLEVPFAGGRVPVGLCQGNALRMAGPPELVEHLLLTRLEFELRRTKPTRTSSEQIRNDWKLLGQARGRSLAALD